ncbi:hypothetical protein [Pseudomonas sp. BP8]|uniref:hypothetical protein n=1 Tax=Pseudomonas sp. BP8 TaxID=2817864 RepID=UPI001AE4F033|nr:hypothetical protein [Pseudomonas sp. BP8]MBP2263645.1 hypothetical protein [Pseudomonas sp. BP8]HDS1738045.1 hypothetical protein [Pseudomonas putida]
MKKIVPDPPTPQDPLYASIHPNLYPPDALSHALELLRGVSTTIDAHCHANAGSPGLDRLANAGHCTGTARALVEHVFDMLQWRQGGE